MGGSILNGLWVFTSDTPPDTAALLADKLNSVALRADEHDQSEWTARAQRRDHRPGNRHRPDRDVICVLQRWGLDNHPAQAGRDTSISGKTNAREMGLAAGRPRGVDRASAGLRLDTNGCPGVARQPVQWKEGDLANSNRNDGETMVDAESSSCYFPRESHFSRSSSSIRFTGKASSRACAAFLRSSISPRTCCDVVAT